MKKRSIIITLFIGVLIFGGIKFFKDLDYSIFRFTVSKEVRLKYVNVVDEVSRGKVQVNWREVASVDATFNYGHIETATENNIKRVAERFITKTDKGYTLRSIDSVVESFGGKGEDIEKAKRYLKVINKSRKMDEGHKKDFFDSIKSDAIKVSKKTGIMPSVIMGQAALESNWGRSQLSKDYKNLFGIKADSSWKGKKINFSTSEYYNTKIRDDFRVYSSLSESVEDFGKFIENNPRYKRAGVFKAKTYNEQIKAIEKAGYSTISNEKGEKVYAQYVLDIIISNDLQLLDWEISK
ncbi:glycoside hydrolase family 73 protein [Clostridium cylindrosporum]|uniref:Mannosyl-glycoprotein endo-beta-N-acetylglucosamidase n=1 Tax=Clostridium cylindrosporum DSM 605 TaxID=1121307 RepID=A0A0J8DGJ3_CLOCY|nr:glucosaminidase domain-containing protein [Clostridium cylindrosporum]KMT23293.1 mannosyl-glycoprotein endo-beta-N-acetylglucosamidase [Clostridium cylindrosporum DSM 605]